MTTAVSLPDDVFCAAEAEAKMLEVSRNELYTIALIEFLEKRRTGSDAEGLPEMYGDRLRGHRTKLALAFHRA